MRLQRKDACEPGCEPSSPNTGSASTLIFSFGLPTLQNWEKLISELTSYLVYGINIFVLVP